MQYIRCYIRNGVIEHVHTQTTPIDFDHIALDEKQGQGKVRVNYVVRDLEMDDAPGYIRARELLEDLEAPGNDVRFKSGARNPRPLTPRSS